MKKRPVLVTVILTVLGGPSGCVSMILRTSLLWKRKRPPFGRVLVYRFHLWPLLLLKFWVGMVNAAGRVSLTDRYLMKSKGNPSLHLLNAAAYAIESSLVASSRTE